MRKTKRSSEYKGYVIKHNPSGCSVDFNGDIYPFGNESTAKEFIDEMLEVVKA